MKRLIILFCLLLIGLTTVILVTKQTNNISLFEASAVQSSENSQMFMAGLRIENSGGPDRLISASSPSAQNISIMNPNGNGSAIIVPENGSGILAMDGTHIMFMTKPGTFKQGAFIPLNLTFEKAGSVSIRVQNTGLAVMNHDRSNSVSENPAPTLSLSWKDSPDQDGATLQLNVSNFTFVRTDNDAEHVPNEGHAHVYLNGLKLGRLYEETFEIGALSLGNYKVSVALNSNDHRPYLNDSLVVEQSLEFSIFEK